MLTFQGTTAPGFFDFSSNQTAVTKSINDAFNNYFTYIQEQQNLFTSIFENWKTRDYSAVTVARTPFVSYQLRQCGLDWFRGSESQAARLAGFVQAGFDNVTSTNIYNIIYFLSQEPFLWCDFDTYQLSFGYKVPAVLSETLVIYSPDGSPPATPANTAYLARDWEAPSGWTKQASLSNYASYGILSGSDIVWSTPIDLTLTAYLFAADIASLPAGTLGEVATVQDDGTGDTSAAYFFDGSSWLKFSTPYDNQGSVLDGVPLTPSQSVVAAPDPNTLSIPLSSDARPPISGPSLGFGIYAGLSSGIVSANLINVTITLTEAGFNNLGVFINLLRRVKPTINKLFLIYTYGGTTEAINIFDTGELI